MTGPLRPGTLIVDAVDVPLLAFLLGEAVRSLAHRRRLPTQVAQLLTAVNSAVTAARFATETTAAARVAVKAQAESAMRGTTGFATETAAGIPSAPTASSGKTVGDAAKGLGMSTQSVRRLCRSGELVAQRHGRAWVIDSASLASLIHRREA